VKKKESVKKEKESVKKEKESVKKEEESVEIVKLSAYKQNSSKCACKMQCIRRFET
jgi:hypothetical protein